MYLIKSDICHSIMAPRVIFDKVAEDLIMVTVNNQLQSNSVPSYWRLTAVKEIPPLELGVDCIKCFISGITFYVDLGCIRRLDNFEIEINGGTVLVETGVFKRENDFIDVNHGYSIYLQANKLTCLFEENNMIRRAFKNGRLEFYVNAVNQIIGFSICDLLGTELSMLRTKGDGADLSTSFCAQSPEDKGTVHLS